MHEEEAKFYDEEEKELITSLERGDWVSAGWEEKNKAIRKAKQYAENTLRNGKTANFKMK
jgi:hypothetical protein